MKSFLVELIFILVIFLAACGGGGVDAAGVEQATLNLGKTVFQANCSACHSATSDAVLVGPSLQNIANWGGSMEEGLDAYQYIEKSVLAPGTYITEGFEDIMPKTFSSILTDKQIDAVIQYLLSAE